MSMQNYNYFLGPGETDFETIGQADFIFVRYADREFELIIDNETVTMEIGAEYIHPAGFFHRFEIRNPDPDNPAVIRLAMGTARYRSRIIQGEVSIVPGIRNAAGLFIEDTRWNLAADVDLTSITPQTFTRATERTNYPVTNNAVSLIYFPDPGWFYFQDNNGAFRQVDEATGTETLLNAADYPLLGTADSYSVSGRGFRGDLSPDGVMYLGARSMIDDTAVVLTVDKNLNVLTADSLGVVQFGRTNTNYLCNPVWIGDKLYAAVQKTTTAFEWYRRDASGWTLVAEKAFSLNNQVIYNEDGLAVVCNRGLNDPDYKFEPDTGNNVALDGQEINLRYGGHLVDSDRTYVEARASNFIFVMNLITWTQTAQGTFETCAGGYVFEPTETLTEALITAEEVDRGVSVSGEVIKLLLELWLGQFVADDYLDHVFKVEFDNADGRAPVTISSGGTSFKGAKIADAFTCVFPQSVRITLDNNLTTKD